MSFLKFPIFDLEFPDCNTGEKKKDRKKNCEVFGVLPKWSQCAMNRAAKVCIEKSGRREGSGHLFSAICEESSQGWGINHTTGPETLSVLSESEAHITLMTIQKSREFE